MWGDVPYDPDEARRTLALLRGCAASAGQAESAKHAEKNGQAKYSLCSQRVEEGADQLHGQGPFSEGGRRHTSGILLT